VIIRHDTQRPGNKGCERCWASEGWSRVSTSGKSPGTSQGRVFKNCPVGNFSEGAGLQGGAKHGVVFAVKLQVF